MCNVIRNTLLVLAAASLLAAGQGEVAKQKSGNLENKEQEKGYAEGMRALDNRSWAEAVEAFRTVSGNKGRRADGALYWEAYALMKQARAVEAQAVLDRLRSGYPNSRWLDDAEALELGIRQSAGRPPAPELEQDDELKLYAINTLAQTDPERAVPLLKKVLEGRDHPKLKERALFVLAMTESEEAIPVVLEIARGGSNPDLQLKAIEYLGMLGGGRHDDALAQIFGAGDAMIQRRVLHAYMISGNRSAILAVAQESATPEVRREAIQLLGALEADEEIWRLYQQETDPELRADMISALAVSGSDRLLDLAKSETDPKLRGEAIKHLGLRSDQKTTDALLALYASDLPIEQKHNVIQGLFLQSKAKELVELAQKEQNTELKKTIVQHLSLMRAPEATAFMEKLLSAP